MFYTFKYKLKKILHGRRKIKELYLYMIYNYIIITIFLLLYFTTREKINIFLRNRSTRTEIIYWPPVDANIQCYKEVHNDALKSIEDPHFSPKTKSIFFHETSCRGGLDSRQACAVESAALAHPDWNVYVLFTSPVTEVVLMRTCLVKLLQYPNIKLARIHVSNYSMNTPVSPIINHRIWKTEKAVQQTHDIMKMLTLNRWGGVSIDLDVLVMKSFNDLPNNWIAKESPYFIASGVMMFSKDEIGQNFTSKVIRQIASTYNPDKWSTNGASAIENVLMRRCRQAVKSTGYCQGITIFGEKMFYPVHLWDSESLLRNENWPPSLLKKQEEGEKPYTYYMWNIWTRLMEVQRKSAFVHLAKKVCPSIYKMYGAEFGV